MIRQSHGTWLRGLKRVVSLEDADPGSITVTLFASEFGIVRGWFIGPVSLTGGVTSMPYLRRSSHIIAQLALFHAQIIAEESSLAVCVIDPENLWPDMWGSL